MAIPLVEITRGGIVESIHQGDVAVVDHKGRLLYSAGDPHKLTFFRSAAKPVQALNVILSGAAAAFQLTNAEIAVICSSHYAEQLHRSTVSKVLNKIGLQADNILGGTVPSLSFDYALQVASEGIELNPLFSDCSGKHSGFLAVCRHKGYTIDNYLNPDHPIQKEILNILSFMSQQKTTDIPIGVDGCSAPVHALPIFNMALAYARLMATESLPGEYATAANRIFTAMNDHPEMISGTNGFCSALIQHTNRKLIGKVGAEGVYCVGLKKEKIGIAVKIENGSMAVIPPVVMKVLRELNVLSNSEQNSLKRYLAMDNLNDLKTVVGKITAIFDLIKH